MTHIVYQQSVLKPIVMSTSPAFDASLLHRTPSIGRVVKKLLEINPHFMTSELIDIIRQCTRRQGGLASEFAGAEVIDEEQAIRLAKESLDRSRTGTSRLRESSAHTPH
jgi:hypothetical protein